MKRIKTGFLERRLTMAKSSLLTGSKILGHSAVNLLSPAAQRKEKNREMMAKQALDFVSSLGQLKGSVVKIGQMLALYGEYFLPEEITSALHSLEDDTTALDWSTIVQVLDKELGADKLAELIIDHEPFAAASLGQVHRARRIADGADLCIKIQYPGVDKSIDSDLNAIVQLLKISRLMTRNSGFENWFKEARAMLHQETDYLHEASKTRFVARMLADDHRYVVPEVFDNYSTRRVLTTSYEPGISILDQKISTLSLTRRTRLAQSALDLFLMELFEWGKIQTDPNYGNYRIRLGKNRQPDQLVLLDFGAMKTFDPDFLQPFCAMILAAYHEDRATFLELAIRLNLLHKDLPDKVLSDFVDIAIEIIEPMAAHHTNAPEYALNKKGHYCWQESQLPKRIAKKAIKQSMTKYFALPPNEFMFINRKLMGLYTFILELRAQFNGKEHLKKYL